MIGRAGALLGLATMIAGLGALALPEARGGQVVAMPLPPALSGDAPRRIVSLNPCADAVLVRVARPDQIAAISHYSHDARATSLPLPLARRFRATGGTAEEVIALRPDLVIAGSHVALPTILMLRRLDVPILQLGVPGSIEEDAQQTLKIARAVGAPERGRALNSRIADALRAAAPPSGSKPVAALIWQSGGMVPGRGTLADALLRRTGFRNASTGYGLAQWDMLPLEYLLARPPSLLLTPLDDRNAEGREALAGHRALRALSGKTRVRDFPPRLLHCGGPTLIEAARWLDRLRRDGGRA